MNMHQKLVQYHEEQAAEWAGEALCEESFDLSDEDTLDLFRHTAGMHIATVNALNGVSPE